MPKNQYNYTTFPDRMEAIYQCLRRIEMLMERPVLRLIHTLPPQVLTVTTTPVSIATAYTTATEPTMDFTKAFVESVAVKVRDMGDATIVSFGRSDIQNATLMAYGDTVIIDAPLGCYLDLSELWISCNNDSAVVEISGTYYAINNTSPPVQPQTDKIGKLVV